MWPRLLAEERSQEHYGLPIRTHVDERLAVEILSTGLVSQFRLRNISETDPIVIICIGTDRSTGDSLGPLVGTNLERHKLPGTYVYGTLEQPVHATNLHQVLSEVSRNHPHAAIIALDACLGKSENVGYISIKEGPLSPGTGVNKKLPDVGDFHLIGVVNVGGFMEYFVLQNTRLGLVYKMAKTMAAALSHAINHVRRSPNLRNTVEA